jgi:hypothetical protein
MKLELADGKLLDVSDIEIVYSNINTLDEKNDHLILSDSDNFMQIAYLGNNFFQTEFRDETGYFQAEKSDLDMSLIKNIFKGFYNRDNDWKNLTAWERIEDNESGRSSSNSRDSRASENVNEDIAEQLKRQALNWGKKKLKKFLKF